MATISVRVRIILADHIKYHSFGFCVFARPGEFDVLMTNDDGFVKSPDAAFKLHPSSLRRVPGTRSDPFGLPEHVPNASFLRIRTSCLRPSYEAIPFFRLLKLFTGSSTMDSRTPGSSMNSA